MIRNLDFIRGLSSEQHPGFGQKLYEALSDLLTQQNNIAQQTNANPTKNPDPPPSVNGVSVTAKDGIFDAKITDNNKISRGAEYFLEYSETPHFATPTVVHVGASRNWRGNLGNKKLYWRAYSQYSTSSPSSPVYHGSSVEPLMVEGGGADGPELQRSAGSGTAPANGELGGSGYGQFQNRPGKDNAAPTA